MKSVHFASQLLSPFLSCKVFVCDPVSRGLIFVHAFDFNIFQDFLRVFS